MASIDEELQSRQQEEKEEKEEKDRDFGTQNDQAEMEEEYRRRLYVEQQQSKNEQAQQLANVATSQIKKSIKKKVLYWLLGLLGFSSPIWGPLLLTLFIGGGFIVGCNTSSLFRAASFGTCELFIISDQGQTFTQGPNNPGGSGVISDAEARAFLAQHGILVTASTLQGVRQTTLDEAVRLKDGCDAWASDQGRAACAVVVTGGTSDEHAEGTCSHANGYKLDFRSTEGSSLNDYIAANFQSVAPRGGSNGGPQWINPTSGGDYVKESKRPVHWDMVVGCSSNT